MGDIRESPASGGTGLNGSDPAGKTTATQLERTARRLGITLRRLLARDKETRSELDLVAAEILVRIERLDEWRTLHHLLYEVLVAFAPFSTSLELVSPGRFSPAQRQALLQNWRVCQDRMDALANFADGIQWIGRPLRQDRHELRGAPWAAEVIALRLLVEDGLKDDGADPAYVRELADEFCDACQRHMKFADQQLQDAIDEVEYLLACLLGNRQGLFSDLAAAP